MNTNTHQGTAQRTATIYQFPLRPRPAGADLHRGADTRPDQLPRISDALDNCWYHDAAVQQAAGPTKG